jgi:hypothetical protein
VKFEPQGFRLYLYDIFIEIKGCGGMAPRLSTETAPKMIITEGGKCFVLISFGKAEPVFLLLRIFSWFHKYIYI